MFVASLFLSLYARPWGNSALKTAIFDLARTRATVGLKEHVFNDEFKGLVIYVEQIEPPGNNLLRILISDRRQPNEQQHGGREARHPGRATRTRGRSTSACSTA